MHKVSIPQSVIDRVVARHGSEHVHADLDPAKTALVVVDMQNAFMMPGVAHAPCLMAQDIVPNINRLARQSARPAAPWSGSRPPTPTTRWKTGRRSTTCSARRAPRSGRRRWRAAARVTSCGPTLDVQADDLTVEKNRYSAFIQGSSDLADVLRARGLDTLLITGTVTNVCCESTARDAMMLNFKTIMLTDGNAAVTDEDHNASLTGFYLIFGDIMSTDFAIDCLKRNAQKGLAAAE